MEKTNYTSIVTPGNIIPYLNQGVYYCDNKKIQNGAVRGLVLVYKENGNPIAEDIAGNKYNLVPDYTIPNDTHPTEILFKDLKKYIYTKNHLKN